MVVPTGFELGIPQFRPRLRSGQVGVETRSRVPPRLRDTLTRGFWIRQGELVINDLSFIWVYSGRLL